VVEIGQGQGGADDVSDLARAGGDVMEGAPAAVSCTDPGSASEVHSGNPPEAATACMLSRWPWALPEYHKSRIANDAWLPKDDRD